MLIRSMGEMSMPGWQRQRRREQGQNVKFTPSLNDCGLFLPTGSAMTICAVIPGLWESYSAPLCYHQRQPLVQGGQKRGLGFWQKAQKKSLLLTHRAACCIQDAPSLGCVHHHLLQALQALLRQLLPVPDEPSEAAVRGVLGHDLDQLWEVVAVPLAAHEREPLRWESRTGCASHDRLGRCFAQQYCSARWVDERTC